MNRRKKRVLGLFTLAAAPLILASVAYACQALTTAAVNPKSGPAGTSVNVTGCNYSNNAKTEVRLDSRTATPLAEPMPSSGCVNTNIVIPAGTSVGYHTVLITQTVNGVPRAGSPGRASFQVTSGAASSASILEPSVLVTPIGLAGLALLVGVSRRRRSAAESA